MGFAKLGWEFIPPAKGWRYIGAVHLGQSPFRWETTAVCCVITRTKKGSRGKRLVFYNCYRESDSMHISASWVKAKQVAEVVMRLHGIEVSTTEKQ